MAILLSWTSVTLAMIHKVSFLVIMAACFYSCAEEARKDVSGNGGNRPVPVDQIREINVSGATLHSEDYAGLIFELADSLVRVTLEEVVIDSGWYSIDSALIRMALKSHGDTLVYDLGYSNGNVTELRQHGTKQILSVSVN